MIKKILELDGCEMFSRKSLKLKRIHKSLPTALKLNQLSDLTRERSRATNMYFFEAMTYYPVHTINCRIFFVKSQRKFM